MFAYSFYYFCKNNIMVNYNKYQKGLSDNLKRAIDVFHSGLGGMFNVVVMVGKLENDEEYDLWNKKGKSDNKKQPSTKYVKKSWKKALMAGTGAVLSVQKHGLRYRTNKEIQATADWFNELMVDHKIEVMSNDTFDLYFIGPLIIETKEDVAKEAHNEETI